MSCRKINSIKLHFNILDMRRDISVISFHVTLKKKTLQKKGT